MKLSVIWHADDGVAELTHEQLALQNAADVARWRELLSLQLAALVTQTGQKLLLLICIDGVEIDPTVADLYGAAARVVMEEFTRQTARYGAPSKIRRLIALEAVRKGYRVNLFESREEALIYLQAQGD